MNKKIEICFQTSPNVREKLEELAGNKGLEVSTLIQNIVMDFFGRKRCEADSGSEKREFPRHTTAIPVVVQIHFGQNETHYRTGTILDISMGGVRITLPKHENLNSDIIMDSNHLEILFRLPRAGRASTFRCEPKRTSTFDENIELGAKFTDADLMSQQLVHKYIM